MVLVIIDGACAVFFVVVTFKGHPAIDGAVAPVLNRVVGSSIGIHRQIDFCIETDDRDRVLQGDIHV